MRDLRQVGVLVATAVGWGRELIQGIAEYAHERRNWHLLIESRLPRFPDRIPSRQRYDGIIALVLTAQIARRLAGLKVPVVNVATPRDTKHRFPGVARDLHAMGRLAADHFLKRGFQSFAVYHHADEPNPLTLAWDVFAESVHKKGYPCLSYADERRGSGFTFRDASLRELAAWLQGLAKPVAVFARDSEHARQLTEACLLAGLAVPEEVAILAGDNDHLHCEIANPPVSGLDCNLVRVGREAAQLLDRQFQGRTVPARTLLIPPAGVVERRSTACLAFDNALVQQAVNYIWQHGIRPLSVKRVAAEVGRSRRNLDQLFVQHLGRPMAAEIRRVRLERARHLLETTNLPVAEVALASGFANAKGLTRLFFRHFQVLPSQYRRRTRHAIT